MMHLALKMGSGFGFPLPDGLESWVVFETLWCEVKKAAGGDDDIGDLVVMVLQGTQ